MHNLTYRRIVDKYEWTFELEPKKEIDRDQLIKSATDLRDRL